MTAQKSKVLMTIGGWFVFTAAYAFIYVREKMKLPDLQGYETEWDWQLLFFCIVRLPWLALLLALILLVLLRRDGH
jgi:hypothetical protein